MRHEAERSAREDLARALAEREHRAGDVVRSHDALSAAYAGIRVSDPAVAACAQAFVERRERERTAAHHALDSQEQQVDRSRHEAVEATRGREVVTRLEDRQRAAWRRDVARAEEAELSEFGLTAYRRVRGGA